MARHKILENPHDHNPWLKLPSLLCSQIRTEIVTRYLEFMLRNQPDRKAFDQIFLIHPVILLSQCVEWRENLESV
jgi:hypothetical protein